jgi:hypothetical protein
LDFRFRLYFLSKESVRAIQNLHQSTNSSNNEMYWIFSRTLISLFLLYNKHVFVCKWNNETFNLH